MLRGRAHCRTHAYSLYAATSIVADRDSPASGGVPRAARLFDTGHPAKPPVDGTKPYGVPDKPRFPAVKFFLTIESRLAMNFIAPARG